MRFYVGRRYKVVEGAGLDSRREGVMLPPQTYSQSWIRKNEPGRYYRFDPYREVLLLDDNGNVFTMFKSYLNEVKNAHSKEY